MTNQLTDSTALSIVLPTMAKGRNLYRCLDSLVHNAPARLLESAELIVFVNEDPIAKVDLAAVERYLSGIKDRFGSLRIVRSDKFELTAEESAWAACAHAIGHYLWLVGDARIFLPEGLVELYEWLRNPNAPAAFFNTTWYGQNGFTNGRPSIHIGAGRFTMTYKQFVMHTGINFMATAMGAWVYERRLLDREKWAYIIKNCGPHFSHVAALLQSMGETPVNCHTAFLYINEAKAYHSGDSGEWVRYSKLSGTYRFYAWTLGLVRQFQHLIEVGAYTYSDVRRSMCSEATLLRRQVDEIYVHLLAQLRYGWANPEEKLTPLEFNEMIEFLSRACPEKAIVNNHLRDLYALPGTTSDKAFMERFKVIDEANRIDTFELRLSSLIVDQIGDHYIRLHPKGFIASPVSDTREFMMGYKLLDAVPEARSSSHVSRLVKWRILDEAGVRSFVSERGMRRLDDLFPVDIAPDLPKRQFKGLTAKLVVTLYRSRFTNRAVNLFPNRLKKRLKSALM